MQQFNGYSLIRQVIGCNFENCILVKKQNMNLLVIITGTILLFGFLPKPMPIQYSSIVFQQDSTVPTKNIIKIKELKSSKISKEKNKNSSLKKKEKKQASPKEKTFTPKSKQLEIQDKIHLDDEKKCAFAFNITNEFTGIRRRGLSPRTFFSYTPNEYLKFMAESDFINCEGFLSQNSAGEMALNINFHVASSDAKQKFGAIPAKSSLVLKTMTGKEFSLISHLGAEPQTTDNSTYYQCSFALTKSDVKQLKKAEIDQVKITFQKGFQIHDVFYLDFLIDQFPCFE